MANISIQYSSPVGPLVLTSNGTELVEINLPNSESKPSVFSEPDEILQETVRQLDAFFAGELTEFELPLGFDRGTEFQRTVWMELSNIPFGTTISYAELARRVGNPSASRAVGAANGRNPIPIVLPCHRVIGANGTMTGYGGGLELKEWLLGHEKKNHEDTKSEISNLKLQIAN